jgi:hypothetical protein
MEECPDAVDLDLDARGELPTRPAEEGQRLESEYVGKHFTAEFTDRAELKPGGEVRASGFRKRSNDAESDKQPDDLADGQAGEGRCAGSGLNHQISV